MQGQAQVQKVRILRHLQAILLQQCTPPPSQKVRKPGPLKLYQKLALEATYIKQDATNKEYFQHLKSKILLP